MPKKRDIAHIIPLPVRETKNMHMLMFGGSAVHHGLEVQIGSTCGVGGVDLVISIGGRRFFLSGHDITLAIYDSLFEKSYAPRSTN